MTEILFITSGEGASDCSMLLQSMFMKSWNRGSLKMALSGREYPETWHSRAFSFQLMSVLHLHLLLPSVPELGDSRLRR